MKCSELGIFSTSYVSDVDFCILLLSMFKESILSLIKKINKEENKLEQPSKFLKSVR